MVYVTFPARRRRRPARGAEERAGRGGRRRATEAYAAYASGRPPAANEVMRRSSAAARLSDLGDQVVDLAGLVGGAIPVVDVDHRHARRARVEHGEQRGEPVERGAVA